MRSVAVPMLVAAFEAGCSGGNDTFVDGTQLLDTYAAEAEAIAELETGNPQLPSGLWGGTANYRGFLALERGDVFCDGVCDPESLVAVGRMNASVTFDGDVTFNGAQVSDFLLVTEPGRATPMNGSVALGTSPLLIQAGSGSNVFEVPATGRVSGGGVDIRLDTDVSLPALAYFNNGQILDTDVEVSAIVGGSPSTLQMSLLGRDPNFVAFAP